MDSPNKDFTAAMGNAEATSTRVIKLIPKAIPRKEYAKIDWPSRNFGLDQNPYDLDEIDVACDKEPLINNSVRKHRELTLKRDFEIMSPDPKISEYLKRRLLEISLHSPEPFVNVIREAVTNLIKYHTSFIAIKRDSTRSTGKRIKINGEELEPISSVYVLDPTRMFAELTPKRSKIKNWVLMPRDPSVNGGNPLAKFSTYEIIHITMDKKTSFLFGTPYILPVLDDVRALRRLEEMALLIPGKHTFKTLHIQVGTDEFPAAEYTDGESELSLIESKVRDLDEQGVLITTHRVKAEAIDSGGQPADISKYLEHFKERVKTGLRLSDIDVGQSGSGTKAGAASVTKAMEDAAQDYQKVTSHAICWNFLLYLVLEGGFDVSYENLPCLQFPKINHEEEMAEENHKLLMYQAGTTTRSEFRKETLGKTPLAEGDKPDTFQEIEGKIAKKYAIPKESSKSTSKSKTKKKKKKDGGKKNASNKARPANQNGKKRTKTRVTANNALDEIFDTLLKCKESFAELPWEKVKESLELELANISENYIQNGISIGGEKYGGYELLSDRHKNILRRYNNSVLHNILDSAILNINNSLSKDKTDKTTISNLLIVTKEQALQAFEDIQKISEKYSFIKRSRQKNCGTIRFFNDTEERILNFDHKTIPINLIRNFINHDFEEFHE